MSTLPPPTNHSAPTDAQLITRSLADPTAFGTLVERHADAMYRYVAARIGPVRAEDVVAETFTTAFAIRARYDGAAAASARPWLYGIAANCLLKHRAAEARWLQRASLAADPDEPDPTARADERADAARLAPHLASALLQLTPAERDVLLLFALEDMSHEQIAKVLGIRRGTAKTRLSRGCARLRAALIEDEHEEGQHATRPQ